MVTSHSTVQAYIGGVDRAIDVIIDDLDGDLSVKRLAGAAGFSPFHFHRVFRSVTGITIAKYVDQARMDRVVGLLATEPRLPLSDIAVRCGFGSASSLTKAFRRSFGVPPRSFDVVGHQAENRRRKLDLCDLHEVRGTGVPFHAEVWAIAARTVAYRRVVSPYEAGNLATAVEELLGWAVANGLGGQALLGYQWDDPDLVPVERCRYDIAIAIPHDMAAQAPFATRHFPTTRAAHVTIENISDEQRILDWLFDQWLPGSGYQPTEMPIIESWTHDLTDVANGQAILLQMPVTLR